VRHLYLFVDTELHQRVEKAAAAVGMKIAPWLRHLVRQMTIGDFPAGWQEARSEERSHDSPTYGTRLGASKAEVIRRLIAQATTEDVPNSWQVRAAERSVTPMRRRGMRDHQAIPR
jgi:hypothetical protein